MYRYTIRCELFYSILVSTIVSCNIDEKIILTNRRSSKKSHLRVINGIEDITNKYPFVVALGSPVELLQLLSSNDEEKHNIHPEFYPTCTGSLVSDEWVLTASHCIWEIEGRTVPTLIRHGHMTVAPNDTRATFSDDVRKAIQHPSYHSYPGAFRNDIGLLLVNKVHLKVYGRISAVDYNTLIGLPVVYSGYGLTNCSKLDTALSRQHKSRLYGEAAVVPCSKLILSQPMVCLARKCASRRQQAYYGDSGGPLLHASRIVGVCSGIDGGEKDEVGMAKTTVMYTAASPYLDWVLTTMYKT